MDTEVHEYGKTKLTEEQRSDLAEKYAGQEFVVLANGMQYSRPISYLEALNMFDRLAATGSAEVRVLSFDQYKRLVAEAALVAL